MLKSQPINGFPAILDNRVFDVLSNEGYIIQLFRFDFNNNGGYPEKGQDLATGQASYKDTEIF
jgi:hypothetical protein